MNDSEHDGDYAGWREDLEDHFGKPDPAAWDAVRGRLSLGDEVTGTVVTRAPFGAWVDIGVGFPALLLIPYIRDLEPADYQAGNWCEPGSEVTATVSALADEGFRIGLRQNGSGSTR